MTCVEAEAVVVEAVVEEAAAAVEALKLAFEWAVEEVVVVVVVENDVDNIVPVLFDYWNVVDCAYVHSVHAHPIVFSY